MTKKRKALIAFFLCILLGLVGLTGLGFYYHSDPSKLKSLAETALSRFTGTECSIKQLSYSRRPLIIHAKGIQFIEHIQGFYFEIPQISANLSFEGAFGRRTLVFQDLRLPAFSLSMHQGWRPFVIERGTEKPSVFRRVLGGLFSFFVFRDIRVREATLEEGHVTGQWEDSKITLNGIHAHLSAAQVLTAGVGIRVQSLSDQLDLTIPRLTVVTDPLVFPFSDSVRAGVKGEEIMVKTPLGNVANALMEGRVTYSPEDERLDFEAFSLSFSGVNLKKEDGSRFVPLPSTIEGKGSFGLQNAYVALPSVNAVFGSVAELRGQLHAHLQERFRVEVTELKAALRNLAPLLPERLKRDLDPFTLEGSALVSGSLQGDLSRETPQWTCDLHARLHENRVTFVDSAMRLEALVGGSLQVRGALARPEVILTANCDSFSLRTGFAQFEQGRIDLSLSGSYPVLDVTALGFRVPHAVLKLGGNEFRLEEIEGQASRGSLDTAAKVVYLPQLNVQTSILRGLSISSKISEEQVVLEATGKDTHVFELLQAMRIAPPDWKTRSSDLIHARAVVDGDGHVTMSSKVEMRDFAFESPDGRFLGESLSFVLEHTIEGTPEEGLNSSVFLYAGEGEILVDRFYFDASRNNVIITGRGRYRNDPSSVELFDLRLQLENLLEITAHGRIHAGAPDGSTLNVHLSKTALHPLFQKFVVEPYKHQAPLLDALRVGGFMSSDLEFSAESSRWAVKGRVFWQEGEALLEKEGFHFQSIELDFPVWHQEGASVRKEPNPAGEDPAELQGFLVVRSAALPFFPPQSLDIPLRAAPGRIFSTSGLSLSVAGGHIDVGRIAVHGPFSASPQLDTKLVVRNVDLSPWFSGIWPGSVQGTVRGRLDPVRWEEGTLRTKGEITADIFGGRVAVSDIEVKRTLSLAPVIHLDATWENLDLSRMTQGTSFGKIEGSLRGRVRGLEMANGQPQRFDLFLETVKKKDVPQKISVQALDNIAQIGGGASPFSGFTGAFVSLFKELPYEKMGVKASLENDVFRINGTIHESGKEYLVKKGGFSGVDVVIGSPGSNTISFKDMVNRIRRVTASREPVAE